MYFGRVWEQKFRPKIFVCSFVGWNGFFVYRELAQNTRPIVRTLHMSKKSNVLSAWTLYQLFGVKIRRRHDSAFPCQTVVYPRTRTHVQFLLHLTNAALVGRARTDRLGASYADNHDLITYV